MLLVAAGLLHSIAVTEAGALWAWGNGSDGRLGVGDRTCRLIPSLVSQWGGETFGGSSVLLAAASDRNSLAVTQEGVLWWWGRGYSGAVGHTSSHDFIKFLPTRVNVQHFHGSKIVCADTGIFHSAAVTEEGVLYTWGRSHYVGGNDDLVPSGLGHQDLQDKVNSTLVSPEHLLCAKVGRCHNLPTQHALALVSGTHATRG